MRDCCEAEAADERIERIGGGCAEARDQPQAQPAYERAADAESSDGPDRCGDRKTERQAFE
jgi:hypothetical protein